MPEELHGSTLNRKDDDFPKPSDTAVASRPDWLQLMQAAHQTGLCRQQLEIIPNSSSKWVTKVSYLPYPDRSV